MDCHPRELGSTHDPSAGTRRPIPRAENEPRRREPNEPSAPFLDERIIAESPNEPLTRFRAVNRQYGTFGDTGPILPQTSVLPTILNQ